MALGPKVISIFVVVAGLLVAGKGKNGTVEERGSFTALARISKEAKTAYIAAVTVIVDSSSCVGLSIGVCFLVVNSR